MPLGYYMKWMKKYFTITALSETLFWEYPRDNTASVEMNKVCKILQFNKYISRHAFLR